MFTIKKMKALFLFIAIVVGTSLFAQTPQQQMQQQQQEPTTEVKDSELEQFATISQDVMQKNQDAQQQMLSIIEDEGMTGDRYQELQMAAANPNNGGKTDASDEEMKKKEKIDTKLQDIEQKLQDEQVAIVEKSGMSVDRYQEIAQAVQSDQELLQKFQKMVMDNSQE